MTYFNPIPLAKMLTIHRLADSDGDNMTSLKELKDYQSQAPKDQQEALGVLINNFDLFAQNRGLPKGSYRTQEIRPDDSKISYDEVLAIAGYDGDQSSISEQDVENPFKKYFSN